MRSTMELQLVDTPDFDLGTMSIVYVSPDPQPCVHGSRGPCSFCDRERRTEENRRRLSPLFCEHANEVPYECPCEDGCYCKENVCRRRPIAPAVDQRTNLVGRTVRGLGYSSGIERTGVVASKVVTLTDGINLERRTVEVLDDAETSRGAATAVEERCAAAHRREVELAAWAAALVAVLVCLGQIAAARAPTKKEDWFGYVEVD